MSVTTNGEEYRANGGNKGQDKWRVTIKREKKKNTAPHSSDTVRGTDKWQLLNCLHGDLTLADLTAWYIYLLRQFIN